MGSGRVPCVHPRSRWTSVIRESCRERKGIFCRRHNTLSAMATLARGWVGGTPFTIVSAQTLFSHPPALLCTTCRGMKSHHTANRCDSHRVGQAVGVKQWLGRRRCYSPFVVDLSQSFGRAALCHLPDFPSQTDTVMAFAYPFRRWKRGVSVRCAYGVLLVLALLRSDSGI